MFLIRILLPGAVLFACQEPGLVVPREAAPYTALDFRSRAPAEIAVLPVAVTLGLEPDALRALRDNAYADLLRKGYSPLALDYVDSRVGPPGDVGPDVEDLSSRLASDAFLSLRVVRMDLVEGGRRRISARATLLDAATGETLFENEVVELALARDARLGPDDVRRLAGRLLSPLPGRQRAGE